MLIPVFVKGHLTFSIEDRSLEFIHQNISVFGVTGLPWAPLSPREHFGRQVAATVRIPGAEPLSFQVPAHIMRESTLYGEHMGLKFDFSAQAAEREKLNAYVNKTGFYPTEYIRKYPRIPSASSIQTFPLRVFAIAESDLASQGPTAVPVIYDVGNLSPNGILLHTENQIALKVLPGEKLIMTLEPRGWFPMQIRVQGLVCRVVDEMNRQNGNLTRYLGVKFAKVDDINRSAFLDLLKDILERLKTQSSGGDGQRTT